MRRSAADRESACLRATTASHAAAAVLAPAAGTVEDVSFDGPEFAFDNDQQQISIYAEFVRMQLSDLAEDDDLSRYIL